MDPKMITLLKGAYAEIFVLWLVTNGYIIKSTPHDCVMDPTLLLRNYVKELRDREEGC